MKEFIPQGFRIQGEGGIVFVITGPSGVGKSSVISALLSRDPKLSFSVSATTRPTRPGEVHGRDYFFVSEEGFDTLIAEGKLLEWTRYQSHRYGTLRSQVVEPLGRGQDVVIKVEVNGALAIRDANLSSPVVLIFLVPPSWEELARRARGRGTEGEEALRERLRIAASEVQKIPEFQYLVVNDDLPQAVGRVEAIIQAERMRIVPCV